jgi:hypothetical protein
VDLARGRGRGRDRFPDLEKGREMNAAPIPWRRYQPEGDIYIKLALQYGKDWADKAAAAALANDGEELTRVIADARSAAGITKPEQEADGTFGNFVDQLATDPLGAPIASAQGILANTLESLYRNPLVLIAVIAALFFAFGGADLIRKKIASA